MNEAVPQTIVKGWGQGENDMAEGMIVSMINTARTRSHFPVPATVPIHQPKLDSNDQSGCAGGTVIDALEVHLNLTCSHPFGRYGDMIIGFTFPPQLYAPNGGEVIASSI